MFSYICISLFCILFTVIYEHFSYGEYSWYMRGMFVYPLLGGAGTSLIFFKKNVNYIIIIGSLIALVGGVLEIIAGYNYVKFLNDTFNNPIYVPTITVEIGVWLSSIAGIGGGLFGLLSCTKICR